MFIGKVCKIQSSTQGELIGMVLEKFLFKNTEWYFVRREDYPAIIESVEIGYITSIEILWE